MGISQEAKGLRERDLCRPRLEEAQLRYIQQPSRENREEYRRVLKLLIDQTLQGK
jgi:hypothetical protein